MSLSVTYFDIPVGAQEAMQVHTTGGQPHSSDDLLVTGHRDIPYATLEGNWLLDRSRELLPDAPEDFWWSAAVSDENGYFADHPVLEVAFPALYTTTGLTFTFWPSTNQWCSEMQVAWYSGETLLEEMPAYPNAPHWTLNHMVESFDKLRITLIRTSQPLQHGKLQRLQMGRVVQFQQDEISSVNILNEADNTLSTLSVDTMTVNIYDRTGRELVPQENQRIELYRDGTLLATQYIKDSSRSTNQKYTFRCQSAIGLLGDTCLGGIYDGMPLRHLLQQILPGREFTLHSFFQNVTVTGYLGVCTQREALQQVAFAIGALVKTQGSQTIELLPLPEAVSSSFSAAEIFSNTEASTRPRYAKVCVMAHTYTPLSDSKTLIDGETLSGTDMLVTFTEPYHSYSITGGTIIEQGANYVVITADGPVTLTGLPYRHTCITHTKQDRAATGTEVNNVLSVEDATLVHNGNVAEVLERLYSVLQLRQTLTQQVVIQGQQVGDLVVSQNPWGKVTRGYIISMDNQLSPTGQTAQVKINGIQLDAVDMATA